MQDETTNVPMKNFKLTCSDGFTATLQAVDMNGAVDAFMAHADVQAHVMEAHPEMSGKAPEEVRATVMGMVSEVKEGEGGEMAPETPAAV